MNIADAIAEKLVLILRDGRKLIGVLRSWDQFGTPVAPHSTPIFLALLSNIQFSQQTLFSRIP